MTEHRDESTGRVGKYRLLHALGGGGMSTVHLACVEGASEVCVLKQLNIELRENDFALARFAREAHVASLIHHPNVARVLDSGVEDGTFCIAMEFIRGKTLEAVMAKALSEGGILPYDVSISILLQVLDGLERAHELCDAEGRPLGIVHRDLTPRNVMIDFDGFAKIIDFGVAKADVDSLKTSLGVLLGTPYYMSPEQALGQSVDHRSDLYTLGAVLFELLTGQRLVQAQTRAKILFAVARQESPPVSSINPHVPQELDAVVKRALEKDPGARYASTREFRHALENFGQRIQGHGHAEVAALMASLFPLEKGSESAAHFQVATPLRPGSMAGGPTGIRVTSGVDRASEARRSAANSQQGRSSSVAPSDGDSGAALRPTPDTRARGSTQAGSLRLTPTSTLRAVSVPVPFVTTDFAASSGSFTANLRRQKARRRILFPVGAGLCLLGLSAITFLIWNEQNRSASTTNTRADAPSETTTSKTKTPVVIEKRVEVPSSESDTESDAESGTQSDIESHAADGIRPGSTPKTRATPNRRHRAHSEAFGASEPSHSGAAFPSRIPEAPEANQNPKSAPQFLQIRELLKRAEQQNNMEAAFRARTMIDAEAKKLPKQAQKRVNTLTRAALWAGNLEDTLHNLRLALDALNEASEPQRR